MALPLSRDYEDLSDTLIVPGRNGRPPLVFRENPDMRGVYSADIPEDWKQYRVEARPPDVLDRLLAWLFRRTER